MIAHQNNKNRRAEYIVTGHSASPGDAEAGVAMARKT